MSILLEYPPVAPTHTVILRGPKFGDTYRYDNQTIKRRTRGDVLKGYKDSDWFLIETFQFDFELIRETDIDELKTFLETSAGLLIQLTDNLDVVRIGYISTPTNEILTQKDYCSHSVTFDFVVDVSNSMYYRIVIPYPQGGPVLYTHGFTFEDGEPLAIESYGDLV